MCLNITGNNQAHKSSLSTLNQVKSKKLQNSHILVVRYSLKQLPADLIL